MEVTTLSRQTLRENVSDIVSNLVSTTQVSDSESVGRTFETDTSRKRERYSVEPELKNPRSENVWERKINP